MTERQRDTDDGERGIDDGTDGATDDGTDRETKTGRAETAADATAATGRRTASGRGTGDDSHGTGDGGRGGSRELPRTTAQNAQLALLLEVASTPKPGNVDREREYPDLRFEQFLAGAVGTHAGFAAAADGDPLGPAFERAIAGMSNQTGGNTQFGAVLLLAPLVAAAGRGELTPDAATRVVEGTTVEDAVAFYRAFEHVDVAVPEPPEGMEQFDVRRGGDAAPALREAELTLADVMERSASRDGIAAEWVDGFGWTFELAGVIERGDGPVTERAASAFLALLSRELDPFVVTQHDRETAYEVRRRANAVLDDEESVYRFAEDLVERGINPGTTADIVAGGLFVALERGLEV